jgi:hypothetical protein
MSPSTFVALAVLVIAVLPGAAYTFAFEREAGSFGVTAADRALRFLASSMVFHLAFAPVGYGIYRLLIGRTGELGIGPFALTYLAALTSVALPAAVGTVLGGLYATRGTREGWCWLRRRLTAHREAQLLRVLLGGDPAPRAWDDLFSTRPNFYVRVKTSDGTMLAGAFAKSSYAAGFPQETDLFLEQAHNVLDDGTIGEALGYAYYLPADQIAWLEIVSPP